VNRYFHNLCPNCRSDPRVRQAAEEAAQGQIQIEAERRQWREERAAEQRCSAMETTRLRQEIERCRQEADGLKQERNRLAARCAEADAAREALARKAQNLDQELEDQRRTVADYQAEAERWRVRAEKLKRGRAGADAEKISEPEPVVAERRNADQERARLKAEAARWRGEAEALRGEVERLGRAVADSRQAEEAARRRQGDLACEVNDLWKELVGQESKLTELRKELAGAREQKAWIAAEPPAQTPADPGPNDQELARLQDQIDHFRHQADAMKLERDGLAASCAGIGAEREELAKQAQNLRTEVEQLHALQAEGQRRLGRERASLQGEIDRLGREVAAAAQQRDLLAARCQEAQAFGQELARRHEEVGEQLRALRAELDQQRQRTAGLQKDLDAAGKQAAWERRQWQDERGVAQRRAEQERVRLQGEIGRLRQEADALRQERDLLGAQCARVENARESTQKRLLDMIGTLTKALDQRGVSVPVEPLPDEPEVEKTHASRSRIVAVILVLFLFAFSLMWFFWSS
jgi:chromosome segregation ATPase